jgi:hypothetical protein
MAERPGEKPVILALERDLRWRHLPRGHRAGENGGS